MGTMAFQRRMHERRVRSRGAEWHGLLGRKEAEGGRCRGSRVVRELEQAWPGARAPKAREQPHHRWQAFRSVVSTGRAQHPASPAAGRNPTRIGLPSLSIVSLGQPQRSAPVPCAPSPSSAKTAAWHVEKRASTGKAWGQGDSWSVVIFWDPHVALHITTRPTPHCAAAQGQGEPRRKRYKRRKPEQALRTPGTCPG